MVRCPRCQASAAPGAGTCPRCGTPLRIPEEPRGAPLDLPVDLDRRAGPRLSPKVTSVPWLDTPAAPPEIDFEILGAPPGPEAEPVESTAPAEPEARRLQEPLELRFTAASAPQRLGSWAADGILSGALAWLLVVGGARLVGSGLPELTLLPPVALMAGLLHFTHCVLGHTLAGRTLGKWMAGIEVVGPDGRHPAPGRAAVRGVLSLLSLGLLGLGLLAALADGKGRALHDRLAGTAVVRTP